MPTQSQTAFRDIFRTILLFRSYCGSTFVKLVLERYYMEQTIINHHFSRSGAIKGRSPENIHISLWKQHTGLELVSCI